MNTKLKYAAQKMIVNNPYHHDFVYESATYFSLKSLFFTTFDLVRIFAYVFVAVKVGMKAPSFLMFRRRNYLNNPDYMMIDQQEYDKLRGIEQAK